MPYAVFTSTSLSIVFKEEGKLTDANMNAYMGANQINNKHTVATKA